MINIGKILQQPIKVKAGAIAAIFDSLGLLILKSRRITQKENPEILIHYNIMPDRMILHDTG